MQANVERKIYWLQVYCALITLVLLSLFAMGFAESQNKKFKEIDVERINVVEKDGKLKMVISNQERQHPGSIDGVTYNERIGQRPPGIIFFNDRGDECGGLIFGGDRGKEQFGSLTFDKFRGDQTIQFAHLENEEGYFSGLKMNDENISLPERLSKIKEIEKLPTKEAQRAAKQEMRDKGEFLVNRLAIGRGRNKSAFIELNDAKGRSRIELSVEANGNPRLNFLDENGKVFYSLPEKVK